MPGRTRAGEIRLVDLGLAAKVRPCLLPSDYPADEELALIIIVPHTTAMRGNRWEFSVPFLFLRSGAFHLQQVQSVSLARLERKLGELPAAGLKELRIRLANLLHMGA